MSFKRSVGGWILFGFVAPHAVVSWLLGALSLAFFFAHKPRFVGAGILTLELREWFAKGRDGRGVWGFSTTLIRTVWWSPGSGHVAPGDAASELDEGVERHERVHVRQFEDAAFAAFWLGLALASAMWAFGWYAEPWQPAVVWAATWLASPLVIALAWITALLRFGVRAGSGSWLARLFDVAYRDSEPERSAYAQTRVWPDGRSWWAERERERGA